MRRSHHLLTTQLRQQWMGLAIGLLALFVALGGPALAQDVSGRAGTLITGKQIKDRSITAKDLSKPTIKALKGARGPRGPVGAVGAVGPVGPSGSEATPAETLAKLLQVDGAGSTLDADLLDGLSAAFFAPSASTVLDGDAAGGDLTGSYPAPQLGAGVVGTPELAADAVTSAKIAPDSIFGQDIGTNAVGLDELRSGSVTLSDLHSGGSNSITLENQGPIAGDSCVYFSRTNSAADRGELVIPQPSPNTGTLSPELYFLPSIVTVDNQVGLTLCNHSGASIDTTQYELSYRIVAVG